MSFYQGLLEAVKTECPVIYITCCHWSDELLALLDHAIWKIMTENQYAIGYEWSEIQRLCDFRTKDSTENRELNHLQRCMESISSEPFCRQRCFLAVKDPHLFMSELRLHALLVDTAKRIVSEDSNHTVVLVIARSPLLSAEQKDTVRYLELRPDDFAEILQQLSTFHYNGHTQEATAESTDQDAYESLAVWSGTQDSEPCKMIKSAKIFDAICDELSIGTRPGVKHKLENKRDRDAQKVILRKQYHYLIEKICRNDFAIFQKSSRTILAPVSEAPIIRMILAASVSLDIRDRPVKKWFAGRYELLLEKDYAEIWILYSLLQSRLHDLLMRAEITETSYRQWISFLKMRLNYDSVAAAFYFRNETNTLYQMTRPLLPSLCSGSDTENALVHNADLLSAAEKMAAEVQPLLQTQADYLFFLRCVCSVLNQFAVKQSEEMLESAFRKAQNGEMLHSFRRDSAASESTIIGKSFSWEDLFRISMSANAPLAGALANHPVLGESVTQQIKQDSDAWNADYTLDINREIVKRPKRKRKNK